MNGPRSLHLAVRLPATTDGSGAGARQAPDFTSFERLARTAERGLFDFLLAAGPQRDEAVPDAAGKPEPLTVLSALAAVTERLGLAAPVGTTAHEPFALARRLATLDHLSAGRAAWHAVVPAAPRATGGRPPEHRARAVESLTAVRALWASRGPDGGPRPGASPARNVPVTGAFCVPRSPQGHPVLIQDGAAPEDRELAAHAADVLLAPLGTSSAAHRFHADVTGRLVRYGRRPKDLRILAGVSVVLGDTAADARERVAGTRRRGGGRRAVTGTVDGAVDRAGGGGLLVGTPHAVAGELDALVRGGAVDGFVLSAAAVPGALDDFVDRVVPLLQERGVFRTAYTGATLRSHLGLAEPSEPLIP